MPTAVAAKVAPSGQGILFLFADPTKNPPVPQYVSTLTTHPTIRVNGGTPIALSNPYWGIGTTYASGETHPKKPYLPWVFYPFIQSAPAVRRESIGTHLNTFTGNWKRTPPAFPSIGSAASGYAGFNCRVGLNATDTATFPQSPLPAGTYEVWETHPADPGLSPDVTYTVRNKAGATLGVLHVDQRVAPSGPLDAGVRWNLIGTFTITGLSDNLVVTQANATATPMAADTIKFVRTSPDLSLRIKATDTVTYSAPDAWAASVGGNAPAATDAAAENLVGRTFFLPLTTPQTMPIGFNLPDPNYYIGFSLYNNLAVTVPPLAALARDADGYPTLGTGSNIGQAITFNPTTNQADGRKFPIVPPGRYQVLWDGTSNDTLANGTEDVSKRVVTGTVGNRKVYDLPAPLGAYGPDLYMNILPSGRNSDGTYRYDIRNLRIFPESVDPANAPKFPAQLLAALKGHRGLRFLDPAGGNGTNVTDWIDYQRPDSYLSRLRPYRSITAKVVRVEPYTGPTIWDPHKGAMFLYTTDGPHGLSTAQAISAVAGTFGIAQMSNGVTLDLSSKLIVGGSAQSLIKVLTPTTFVQQFGPGVGDTATPVVMTNVLTPTDATVTVKCGNGMTIGDMVDMCNAVGADFYLTTQICTTDACLATLGQYVATHLKPGLKFRVECSNEVWNTPDFRSHWWFIRETFRLGLGNAGDQVPAYCEMARHHWKVIGDAMAAAGRPGDMVRVLASQHTNTTITDRLAKYCKPAGITFDELAIAPYWQNGPALLLGYGGRGPAEVSLVPISDLLTVEQQLDFYEAFYRWGGHDLEVPGHLKAMADNFIVGPKVISYEGGFEGMMVGGSTARQGERSHAAHRHPRAFTLVQNILKVYQDSGMTFFHDYLLSGGDGGGPGGFAMWPVFTFTGMPPGTGDSAENPDPDDLYTVKSQVGGGLLAWAARVAGTAPPDPDPGPDPTPSPTRFLSYFRSLLRLRRR